MRKTEKLYIELDELIEEYRQLLIREFEREDTPENHSKYLYKKRRGQGDPGQLSRMSRSAGHLGPAHEVIELENRLLNLCSKLKEATPAPVRILEEYGESYRSLIGQKETYQIDWKRMAIDDRKLRANAAR